MNRAIGGHSIAIPLFMWEARGVLVVNCTLGMNACACVRACYTAYMCALHVYVHVYVHVWVTVCVQHV